MRFWGKRLHFGFFGLIFFANCSKGPKIHCENLISPIPYYVAFVHFDSSILDTILIHRYTNNSPDKDTLYSVSDRLLTITNDTSSPILYFHPSWTYEISFSDDSKVFKLENPEYPKGDEWDTRGNCSAARMTVSPPTQITVNGQKQSFKIVSINKAVLYLQ